MPPRKRTLILTLDAFETIFVPRHPIPNQYVYAARKFNLSIPDYASEKVKSAFKTTFKALSSQRPNYGRDAVLRGEYGGPQQWWEEAIRGSLGPGLADEQGNEQEIPRELVDYLLNRFSSKLGYKLYPDVDHFLKWAERLKLWCERPNPPFDNVLLGVISNSDDRVPVILESLGIRVGPGRAAPPSPQGVDGLTGFETDREPESSSARRTPMLSPDGRRIPRIRQAFRNHLDFVVTSYQAGAEKPSPVIFDAAKKTALNLAKRRRVAGDECVCVHIGDDYEKDYRAAVDAGWDAFFLDRPGDASVECPGEKRVRSFIELTRKLDWYVNS